MARQPASALLRTLASSIWLHRGRVIAAAVLLVVAKLAAVAVPLMLKRIVDVMSRPEALAALPVLLLAGYAAVRFATTLFSELRDLVFVRVTQTTVADFTLRVFDHLHSLGARFHANRSTGALSRDVERGTAAIGFLIGVALFTIVPTVVEIGAVLAIMTANYTATFALIIAGTFVVYSLFSVVFIARRAVRQRAVNELDSNAHRRLVDSLLNYETVKVYANEAFETQRFGGIMRDWIEAGIFNQRALTSLHVGQSAIIGCGIASVMLLAGAQVLDARMTVGDLVLVNAYVIQVCLPLNSLGFVIRESNDALVKAERLLDLLGETPEEDTGSRPALAGGSNAEVRFEHVGFGYEPSRRVLTDVDFTIAPGRTLAVVGGSGSGKSTLARLLLRFFEPWEGRIAINGVDIREISRRSLREAIGIVPQDTSLFNETIAYNIGYGRIGATHEEIVAAARAASVHDFIEALPEGYDTVVGERGLKLSGGEKQRIAIARAMLKDPPILLLDEATSALDMRSERAIQAALERLAEKRTTLVIAHRLATIVGADEILVLEAGHVVERGTHEALLEADGLYAQMWSLQQQERALRRAKRRRALEAVDLGAVAADAIAAARRDLDEKHLNLYTSVAPDVGLVTGDPWALREVAETLLKHAIRVSDPGARIEVALERSGNEAVLRVTDLHAPGETLPAPGTDANGDAPRFDPQTLNAILEEHHGRLAVERLEPHGTAYLATLPIRAVSTDVAAPAELEGGLAPEPARDSLRGRSLVIVDDDEDARASLRLLLELHGAHAETFESAHAALDYLRSRRRESWPDLMICDIGLPDEDGYALLRRVRAVEAEQRVPLGKRMPAIALTGYAQPEDRLRALMAGFQMHLAKPALPRELLATIDRLIRGPANA